MATIPYQAPRHVPNGLVTEPNIYQIPTAATLIEGDVTTISAGVLSKAAANAAIATVAGFVRAGTVDSYGGQAGTSRSSVLGPNQAGNALIPGTNNNPQVIAFTPGIMWELSLNQATTLATTLVGTQAGLNFDATSGFFFVDTTQSNKIFEIVQVSGGPDSLFPPFASAGAGNGVLGDSGGRVYVIALPGAGLI
jgi:hypothetical protein